MMLNAALNHCRKEWPTHTAPDPRKRPTNVLLSTESLQDSRDSGSLSRRAAVGFSSGCSEGQRTWTGLKASIISVCTEWGTAQESCLAGRPGEFAELLSGCLRLLQTPLVVSSFPPDSVLLGLEPLVVLKLNRDTVPPPAYPPLSYLLQVGMTLPEWH
ncbi:hypothetical protein FQN60_015273, partial [Etheostoma spectabile]